MKKHFTTISTLAMTALLLTGCAATSSTGTETAACQQLNNESTCVPTTDAEVIDLVRGRYADCLAQLTETKDPVYARADEANVLPGDVQFVGADWAVLIHVGEVTDRMVLPTVPDSGKSTEVLVSVGC